MPQLVRRAAAAYGDDVYLVEEDGRTLTFRELETKVEEAARALIALGVEDGDRVAIWAPNSGAWIVAACAIQMIGAVMTPINTRFRGQEAGYILEKSRAKALFTVGGFLGSDYVQMLRSAMGGPGGDGPISGLPALKAVVLFDEQPTTDGALSWRRLLNELAPREALLQREAAVRPETLCDILFTSGTTGAPKGAMHSHGQALWMVQLWNKANDLRRGDRALIVNPFFHSFGYRSGWVSALLAGMSAYPTAVFDPGEALRRIEAERISVLMGSPTLFNAILDHPERGAFDLSSLRVGHTGSSNVPVELIRRAREELGFELFLTSYGLTEATALVSVNTPGDDFETIARTVGRALPGTELKIAAPNGEAGELLVRGPNVMQGYFEDAAATAKAIDAEGWLHTGDVGRIDAEGRLRILDRLKDVVIVGGFNAYPAEIEHALLAHPAIAEAAVIAAPDARMGEVCAAFVVLKPGASLALAELTTWARERLANFKVPRHLFLEEALPKTPLGKVQKFVLKQAALERLGVG
ncbi:AMP-binding protein [Phenylobacterium sp. LjRoot225]|uniref:AMP-binding protein n=1 Tax=Phenylobacterium sp. LjRoot225 TaxID=3342285 RepID=UPI003ECCBFBC